MINTVFIQRVQECLVDYILNTPTSKTGGLLLVDTCPHLACQSRSSHSYARDLSPGPPREQWNPMESPRTCSDVGWSTCELTKRCRLIPQRMLATSGPAAERVRDGMIPCQNGIQKLT